MPANSSPEKPQAQEAPPTQEEAKDLHQKIKDALDNVRDRLADAHQLVDGLKKLESFEELVKIKSQAEKLLKEARDIGRQFLNKFPKDTPDDLRSFADVFADKLESLENELSTKSKEAAGKIIPKKSEKKKLDDKREHLLTAQDAIYNIEVAFQEATGQAYREASVGTPKGKQAQLTVGPIRKIMSSLRKAIRDPKAELKKEWINEQVQRAQEILKSGAQLDRPTNKEEQQYQKIESDIKEAANPIDFAQDYYDAARHQLARRPYKVGSPSQLEQKANETIPQRLIEIEEALEKTAPLSLSSGIDTLQQAIAQIKTDVIQPEQWFKGTRTKIRNVRLKFLKRKLGKLEKKLITENQLKREKIRLKSEKEVLLQHLPYAKKRSRFEDEAENKHQQIIDAKNTKNKAWDELKNFTQEIDDPTLVTLFDSSDPIPNNLNRDALTDEQADQVATYKQLLSTAEGAKANSIAAFNDFKDWYGPLTEEMSTKIDRHIGDEQDLQIFDDDITDDLAGYLPGKEGKNHDAKRTWGEAVRDPNWVKPESVEKDSAPSRPKTQKETAEAEISLETLKPSAETVKPPTIQQAGQKFIDTFTSSADAKVTKEANHFLLEIAKHPVNADHFEKTDLLRSAISLNLMANNDSKNLQDFAQALGLSDELARLTDEIEAMRADPDDDDWEDDDAAPEEPASPEADDETSKVKPRSAEKVAPIENLDEFKNVVRKLAEQGILSELYKANESTDDLISHLKADKTVNEKIQILGEEMNPKATKYKKKYKTPLDRLAKQIGFDGDSKDLFNRMKEAKDNPRSLI